MSAPQRSDALTASVTQILGVSKNCAQTAFTVLQEELGLDGGLVLKALTPFPGLASPPPVCTDRTTSDDSQTTHRFISSSAHAWQLPA